MLKDSKEQRGMMGERWEHSSGSMEAIERTQIEMIKLKLYDCNKDFIAGVNDRLESTE